jgi:hypothetical protein
MHVFFPATRSARTSSLSVHGIRKTSTKKPQASALRQANITPDQRASFLLQLQWLS